jgi:hypothetical protein
MDSEGERHIDLVEELHIDLVGECYTGLVKERHIDFVEGHRTENAPHSAKGCMMNLIPGCVPGGREPMETMQADMTLGEPARYILLTEFQMRSIHNY